MKLLEVHWILLCISGEVYENENDRISSYDSLLDEINKSEHKDYIISKLLLDTDLPKYFLEKLNEMKSPMVKKAD